MQLARQQPAQLAGIVLQAPVSDREYLATLDTTAAHITLAHTLHAQSPTALMPLEVVQKKKEEEEEGRGRK